MAHPDPWKSRNEAVVTNNWRIKTQAQPDEILSSFLIRAGLKNHLDPMSLAISIWGNWRAWVSDIDRRLPASQLLTLSDQIGVPSYDLKRLTLAPTIKRISSSPMSPYQRWFWTTSLGHRNAVRRQSTMFCPRCLTADPDPYFRLHWRLSWISVCTKHEILLQDECPHCRYPIHPHRYTTEHPNFAYCSSCKKPLSDKTKESSAKSCLVEQQRLGLKLIYSDDPDIKFWFDELKFLIQFVRRALRSKCMGANTLIRNTLGEDFIFTKSPFGNVCFPDLSLNDRQLILSVAYYLHSLKPEELGQVLMDSAITYSLLTDNAPTIPFGYQKIAKRLPCKKFKRAVKNIETLEWPSPRSEEQVKRKVALIYKEIRSSER